MKKKLLTVVLTVSMVLGSVFSAFAVNSPVGGDEETSVQEESTTQNSPDGGDAETSEQESTTKNSPSGGDEETSADDTTTEEAPTTDGEDETTTETSAAADTGVVSAEDVAKIAKEAVLTNAPEGAELEVKAVTEDSEDYSIAKKFVEDELKAKVWAVLDLKLVKDNAAIQPDGKIKITLPLFENLKDAKYVAVYRLNADTDKFVSLGTVEVKDGKFTFDTDHFSTYLFVSADKPADGTLDGENGKTGDTAPIGVIIAVALAAVGAVVLVSAKKKNA